MEPKEELDYVILPTCTNVDRIDFARGRNGHGFEYQDIVHCALEKLEKTSRRSNEDLILMCVQVLTKNRYPSEEIRARVRTEFLHALNQLLGSASTKDNPRQLLK